MLLTLRQAGLAASPELFPLALDPAADRVRLVRLAPVDYEKASFLDDRLQAPSAGEPAFAAVAEVAEGLPVACDLIFHLGHVGSTLVSRLLGTHPRIFSLREPQALRTLAAAEVAGQPWSAAELDKRASVLLALFSRTWGPPKRSLIKATSLVSGMAPRLMRLAPDARALLMISAPETYLAAIFSGANLGDVERSAALRIARLNARLAEPRWTPEALSPGELAALAWAADMAAFADLGRDFAGRTQVIDFDAFLADPEAGIAGALAHLHGEADRDEVARLAGSAYLQRYSKAPEYGYGPQVRAQVLAEARAAAGDEIARGLAWLERTARDLPEIAAAIA